MPAMTITKKKHSPTPLSEKHIAALRGLLRSEKLGLPTRIPDYRIATSLMSRELIESGGLRARGTYRLTATGRRAIEALP
jgi:hypothetical protein